jgi:hypothetical protein
LLAQISGHPECRRNHLFWLRRQLPYRSPLAKLDQVKKGQQIVLLLDDQGYVLEIASPEIPPSR